MWLPLLVLNISSFELVKFHMHKNSILWWHKTRYMYFYSLFYPARGSTEMPDQCHKLQTLLPLLCLVPCVAGNSSLFHVHVAVCASFPRTREGSLNTTLVHCVILHNQILLLPFFSLADYIVILLSDLWFDYRIQLTSEAIAVGSIDVKTPDLQRLPASFSSWIGWIF